MKAIELHEIKEGDTFTRFGFTPSLPWHNQLDTKKYVRGHRVSLGEDVIKCSAVADSRIEIFLPPCAVVFQPNHETE